jgi:hypothetical protein
MDFPNMKIGFSEVRPYNPWSVVYWPKAKYIKFLRDGLKGTEYTDNSHLWKARGND